MAEKKAEVNEIAQVIGKPPVEGKCRVSAQLIDPGASAGNGNGSAGAGAVGAIPAGQMARALSGRGPAPVRI